VRVNRWLSTPSIQPTESPSPYPLPEYREREVSAHDPGFGGGSARPGSSNLQPQTSNPPPPAIQLHNSYLVAQAEDGLVIIDQHALHERIMYEELLARVSRGPLESQRLLI